MEEGVRTDRCLLELLHNRALLRQRAGVITHLKRVHTARKIGKKRVELRSGPQCGVTASDPLVDPCRKLPGRTGWQVCEHDNTLVEQATEAFGVQKLSHAPPLAQVKCPKLATSEEVGQPTAILDLCTSRH
ncbi:MAG TPA: hypothetical protein VHR39_03445 [Propionibacteriaceae bacterium]|nr:hypothetical protein [Propionibacteriaceae bacterium]